MPFSDEELIAFLLGDASSEAARIIRLHLEADADLVARLSQLRLLLGHIDSLADHYEPPTDLVASTMARVDAIEAEDARQIGESAPRARTTSAMLSPAAELPRSRRMLWDSTALVVSLTVICCLVLPALLQARFESRRVQCSDNLRLSGYALIDYALRAPDQRFPRIATVGPAAFAGAYAIHLNDAGLLDSMHQLQCPSLPQSGNRFLLSPLVGKGRGTFTRVSAEANLENGALCSLPSVTQLDSLPRTELDVCRLLAGGDYAYCLGVIEGERPVPPRNAGRSNFAIMADAPVIRGTVEDIQAHGGTGINLLYEDGHVQFLSTAKLFSTELLTSSESGSTVADYPFRNTRGQHQVGLHPQDASLAPSNYAPLGE
ncbi:MAG: hypothetical protein R3C53_13035 [Pirellulaceae bacterium]